MVAGGYTIYIVTALPILVSMRYTYYFYLSMELPFLYRVITITCLLLVSASPLSLYAATTSEQTLLQPGLATTSQASSSATIIKSKLLDRAWGRLINMTANITARQEKILARLEQISVRLETRISLTAGTTSDITKAKQELFITRTALAESRTTLRSISITVSTTTNTAADIDTAWRKARTSYLESNTNLQTAKQAIIRSLAALGPTTSSTTMSSSRPRN